MDIQILYGLISVSGIMGGGSFLASFFRKSILWALFPFFGALIAWETYVQLGMDGAVIVGYGVSQTGTITPITADPGILALVAGFLILINFCIMLLIGIKRRR